MVNLEYQGTGDVSSINDSRANDLTPAEQAEVALEDVKCEDCGEVFPENGMLIINGKYICQDCKDDHYFVCEDCGSWHHEDEACSINDEKRICNDCYQNYSHCEDCDDDILTDNSYTVEDGRIICERCYDNYRECSECGYIGHEDNMRYCDSCDNNYCDGCGCNCGDEDCEFPRNYFDKQEVMRVPLIGIVPDKIKYPRLVGVEIEAERDTEASNEYLNDLLPKQVGICHDGSLHDDKGCEIQTPPASYEKLSKMVKDITKVLRSNDFYVNKDCGLHIHIDAADFRRRHVKLANVIKTYFAIEDVFYDMLPDSRKNNEFCLPLRNYFSFDDFSPKSISRLEETWYAKGKTRDYDSDDQVALIQGLKYAINRRFKKNKYNFSRYTGVNVHSVFFRGTLEIRHHSGTLNANKIFHWINFNLAIVEYGMKRYNDERMRKLLKTKSSKKKLTEIIELLKLDGKLKKYLVKRFDNFKSSCPSGSGRREEEAVNIPF